MKAEQITTIAYISKLATLILFSVYRTIANFLTSTSRHYLRLKNTKCDNKKHLVDWK
jgi:hypothetical protein